MRHIRPRCAAPGSKTAQLIELLAGGAVQPLDQGVLVANDADTSRCYMLVHQV
jgi:tRNA (cytosine34-C5)-methyltransferase